VNSNLSQSQEIPTNGAQPGTDDKDKDSITQVIENKHFVRFEVLGYENKQMNFIENTVIAKILKYFAYFREDIKKIIMNHRAAKA
jgi:hypothetical protein